MVGRLVQKLALVQFQLHRFLGMILRETSLFWISKILQSTTDLNLKHTIKKIQKLWVFMSLAELQGSVLRNYALDSQTTHLLFDGTRHLDYQRK